MNRHQETAATWNKLASLYQDKFMDLDFYNESYELISDLLIQDEANLLEIGCGPGNISRYLLSKRPELKITGIDISPNMIELAKRIIPVPNFGSWTDGKLMNSAQHSMAS
ncbi:trans-aconitate 2-methyltransferase [Filimonas sp.]|jgi:SAM-dependent methyltransferase|nr:trans-aconitate 2-methyltransferase [Filimonas sp.]